MNFLKLASRMSILPSSGTIGMLELARRMEKEGKTVIHLEVGEPDFDTPSHIKDAAVKALEEGLVKYTESKGIPELRSAIASWIREKSGCEVDVEEVIVTPGAKHAIFCAILALLEPGDEVIIPSPVWPTYKDIARFAGGIPREVPLSRDYSLDEEAVKEAISEKTKMIILNSPNNPTGGVISRDEMKAVVDLAVDHGFYIMSDEIYDGLTYDGFRQTSILSFEDARGISVLIHGFSKSYAMTGWRVGYAVASRELVNAMSKIQQNTTTCAASFVQKAALEALRGPQDCVEEMRREYDRRRRALVKALNEIDGVYCPTPKGAFYVFPDLSAYVEDSVAFAEELLKEEGVCVTPGKVFGLGGEGHVRISYAASMKSILEGVEKIREFLSSMRR
ncbi:MAG: pyridoxal phosphate-dependent aminotransferase [Candidatus Jordarchaeales archaeon]|nr:pyridoxal phosphate-dependent aminotransferase [Candidatus Jordarchaeia archaeon]